MGLVEKGRGWMVRYSLQRRLSGKGGEMRLCVRSCGTGEFVEVVVFVCEVFPFFFPPLCCYRPTLCLFLPFRHE